ncbi:MAG: YcnI family protein [Candidatus Woykebacteria bacterium]
MRNKLFISLALLPIMLGLAATSVFAHVVVKPDEVGLAARQVFTVSVPNEMEIPTVALRLVIPEGLDSVIPNVKPGWKIAIKKEGKGEEAKEVEINWTGGLIPEGQRDEFLFSAQAPGEKANLLWKAYQTYSDGTVVSWDQEPKENLSEEEQEEMEKKGLGPYSTTKVVDDLSGQESKTENPGTDRLTTWSAYAALVVAVAALVLSLRKNKTSI